MKKELLEYSEQSHNRTIKSIEDFGELFITAARLINKLTENKLNIKVTDVMHGSFLNIVEKYWKDKHKALAKGNALADDIGFEAWMKFKNVDSSQLEELEMKVLSQRNLTISFYKKNDLFWSINENANSYHKITKNIPKKVSFTYHELISIDDKDNITVKSLKEYFCLYATSERQLKIVAAIEQAVELVKIVGVKEIRKGVSLYDLEVARKHTSREFLMKLFYPFIKDIEYDLSGLKLNFLELLKQ